jgi:hypothetical protein
VKLDFLAKQRTNKRMRQKVCSDACWLGGFSVVQVLKSIFYNRGMELLAVNQAYNSITWLG